MHEPLFDRATVERYVEAGWWGRQTLGEVIARHATSRPDDLAFVVGDRSGGEWTLSWSQYERSSTHLAAALLAGGLEPGERLGVLLPDGASVHVAYQAAEKAGLTLAAIGARAGDAEVRHLLRRTGARALMTHAFVGERPATELLHALRRRGGLDDLHHITLPDRFGRGQLESSGPDAQVLVDGRLAPTTHGAELPQLLGARRLGPNDLFMLNSTSGTTGMPKCVMHTQNRWFYFHQMAAAAGALHADDVFYGAVPAPFGFGLWTAHFSPAILGCPTVLCERFETERALRAMAYHRVTVLACVSTQFIMMLNSPVLEDVDLSALRVMFTGGEAVPYERAAAFEDRTGATVLQVYGSNETGALSRTSLGDSRRRRFGTAGRVLESMEVRVFDESGAEVTGQPPLVGIPAARGPAACVGYWDDADANAQLFTDDGWMLMGDVVEIDAEGYLRLVGRTSDFIIRGGKNISAPAVEAEIAEHPDVAHVAVVAAPDDVFGERVCAYVVPRDGSQVSLDSIIEFLAARDVSREWFPERLVVVADLPRSSGAKVAKGELRADIRRRLATKDGNCQPT